VYLKYSQTRLQYNDHGYIELTAIKKPKMFPFVAPSQVITLLHKCSLL